MLKIVEYYIASGSTEEELIISVNAFIKKGWQPNGSIAIDSCGHSLQKLVYQAVVKYEDIHECLWEIKHAGNKATGYKTVQCVICQKQLENAIDNTRTNE